MDFLFFSPLNVVEDLVVQGVGPADQTEDFVRLARDKSGQQEIAPDQREGQSEYAPLLMRRHF
jgi:hypothetical protein